MTLPVNEIICGDCLDVMKSWPADSVDCCVTSPPYWGLRDYGTARWEGGDPDCDHTKDRGGIGVASSTLQGGKATTNHQQEAAYRDTCGKCGAVRVDGQLGLEHTPQEYIARMVAVFEEVRRVLKPSGTMWLNIGDSYAASPGQRKETDKAGSKQTSNAGSVGAPSRHVVDLKPKDLCMIPARLALALQDAGWWLRSDIIWAKPNPMPESVTDRPTSAHEHIFLLAKSERYFYDAAAIAEPVTGSTLDRLNHDVEGQVGSERANGGAKTNGNMKAVGRGGRNAFRGQGANRDTESGPANREGRDMKNIGVLKGNRKTFRGGGVYTGGASFDNSADKPNDSIGNEPNPTLTRNARNVWEIATRPFKQAHFATFPPELPRRCILAGCPQGGIVLDPFFGSGTVGMVAQQLGRQFVGIELKPDYCAIARKRTAQKGLAFE